MTDNPKAAPKPFLDLLAEVDALCALYIGKDAPGEQWKATLDRFERLNKLRKAARRAIEKSQQGDKS